MIEEVRILLHIGTRSNHDEPDPNQGIAYQREAVADRETHGKAPQEPDEYTRPRDRVTPEELRQQSKIKRIVVPHDQDRGGDSQQTTQHHAASDPHCGPVQGSESQQQPALDGVVFRRFQASSSWLTHFRYAHCTPVPGLCGKDEYTQAARGSEHYSGWGGAGNCNGERTESCHGMLPSFRLAVASSKRK